MNQIDIPDYQYYVGCNAKRMVRLTFLEKSSFFNRKSRFIRLLFRILFLKNSVILWCQGVVESEPN